MRGNESFNRFVTYPYATIAYMFMCALDDDLLHKMDGIADPIIGPVRGQVCGNSLFTIECLFRFGITSLPSMWTAFLMLHDAFNGFPCGLKISRIAATIGAV